MKKNTFAAKIVAAAVSCALVAAPAVAFAQPAATVPADAPIVAQSDYTDSFLIAIYDAGYVPSEVTITDLDTYINVDGYYVDYIGFNAYGTHFDYEVDHFTGEICSWWMFAL